MLIPIPVCISHRAQVLWMLLVQGQLENKAAVLSVLPLWCSTSLHSSGADGVSGCQQP
jgi:hypothetical protein